MEDIRYGIEDLKEFVIIARNENNSVFYVIKKIDFKRELNLEKNNPFDKKNIITEESIIDSINVGTKYYTYNEDVNTFTNVVIVKNHIKSVKNKYRKDNISLLPLIQDIKRKNKEWPCETIKRWFKNLFVKMFKKIKSH